MRFDDRLADCQAHAAALRLRRKEWVEYLVGFAQGQPGACVIYRDLDLAVLAQLRVHGHLAACVLYRLNAIHHQVHEHLVKLHAVRHDFGQFGGKFDAHLNRVSSGLALQQRDHFLDDSVHIDQFTLWRRLLVEGTYTVDDFRRTIPCRSP